MKSKIENKFNRRTLLIDSTAKFGLVAVSSLGIIGLLERESSKTDLISNSHQNAFQVIYILKKDLSGPAKDSLASRLARIEQKAIAAMNDYMLAEGSLISVQSNVIVDSNGDESKQWTYLFRSEADYQHWSTTLRSSVNFSHFNALNMNIQSISRRITVA